MRQLQTIDPRVRRLFIVAQKIESLENSQSVAPRFCDRKDVGSRDLGIGMGLDPEGFAFREGQFGTAIDRDDVFDGNLIVIGSRFFFLSVLWWNVATSSKVMPTDARNETRSVEHEPLPFPQFLDITQRTKPDGQARHQYFSRTMTHRWALLCDG